MSHSVRKYRDEIGNLNPALEANDLMAPTNGDLQMFLFQTGHTALSKLDVAICSPFFTATRAEPPR